MHPVLFSIGPLHVFSYGVLMAMGFFLGMFFVKREFVKLGIHKDVAVDFAMTVLIWGVIGARLFYVFSNLNWFLENPLDIFMIYRGGLIYYGGLIFACLAAIIFLKIKKLNLGLVLDAVAVYVALGQFFGRIGCFLNGCCFGYPTTLPVGVVFPDKPYPVHPVQLYEAFLLLLLFIFLLFKYKHKIFPFETLILYFLGYGAIRFFTEFFRADNPYVLANMSLSQILSFVIFVAAFFAYLIKYGSFKRGRKNATCN